MPRYFFDINDGQFLPDTEGTDCADCDAARREAMISLPEIARWIIPGDGDNQAFTVLVRDETGTVVYTATLTYAGLRLDGAAVAETGPVR
ncbi:MULTISPECIES: DUF6894 family protein [Methylobacterium]|uniref:DUF6894 domain-containing protein n=1 Tax=Methylobacterium longum TaxID=767694 RepID=A0ABT8ATM6_9HYPH|nr:MULTISPECIES: hypothetical protein [Methylobacterium]MCJ2097432.1 hypothetical protein [Methylobacterium sp. E-046]MDN3573012.1 hypothetical protein [Methylobacterium longum]GJE14879.1 hypothetical protein FOHLNKBM_5955 [Methylobacterium longum]